MLWSPLPRARCPVHLLGSESSTSQAMLRQERESLLLRVPSELLVCAFPSRGNLTRCTCAPRASSPLAVMLQVRFQDCLAPIALCFALKLSGALERSLAPHVGRCARDAHAHTHSRVAAAIAAAVAALYSRSAKPRRLEQPKNEPASPRGSLHWKRQLGVPGCCASLCLALPPLPQSFPRGWRGGRPAVRASPSRLPCR